MVYKLIKTLPKHEIGELVILSENANNMFYEWLESPNYILPLDVVEDSSEFFEFISIDWEVGDRIFYINSFNEIIENIFNLKTHIKLVISNNAFKTKEIAQWVLDKRNMLMNDEILITDKESILLAINTLKKDKDIEGAINILNKIIE